MRDPREYRRWFALVHAALACATASATLDCGGEGSGAPTAQEAGTGPSTLVDPAVLERGEYLVRTVAGCGECHTPRDAEGNLDQSQWLAGVANRFDVAPDDDTIGAVSAPNLTPAAIGSWTDDDIKRAFLDGVATDGTPLVPLMPYAAYHNMTAADADAIVTYLRNVPSIQHRTPARQPLGVPLVAPAPPIPEEAIPRSTLPASDPNRAAADRGRYLAGEVGFCLDCHTPWRLGTAQPLDLTRVFAGGRAFSAKEWTVPPPAPLVIYSLDVTPHTNGIAGWSADDVANVLRTGVSPHDSASLCRPMPSGPLGAFGALSREDARDIGWYLTTIPPIDGGDIPACANP
jgi:mono/diheme cytochrome c family protein